MRLIHRLQNSPLTGWMWRMYLHNRTHEFRVFPIWKRVGSEWRRFR